MIMLSCVCRDEYVREEVRADVHHCCLALGPASPPLHPDMKYGVRQRPQMYSAVILTAVLWTHSVFVKRFRGM